MCVFSLYDRTWVVVLSRLIYEACCRVSNTSSNSSFRLQQPLYQNQPILQSQPNLFYYTSVLFSLQCSGEYFALFCVATVVTLACSSTARVVQWIAWNERRVVIYDGTLMSYVVDLMLCCMFTYKLNSEVASFCYVVTVFVVID